MNVTVYSLHKPYELRTVLEERCGADHLTWIEQSSDKIDIDHPAVAQAELLILDCQTVETLDWSSVEMFNLRHPQSTTVLILSGDLERVLMQAMRVGVRDVIARTQVALELVGVIDRAHIRVAAIHGIPTIGKILAFIPCKGGSGTSFIASNLAYVLGELHHKKVLLLDLDLQFSDASFYMTDDSSTRSLGDVIRRTDLDGPALEAACVRIGKSTWLLRAPSNPEQAIGVTPDQLDAILTVATQHFEFVFVDLERTLDPLSLRVMDQSDTIYPIMQTVLPFVRGAQRLQRMFRALHYPESKIRIVANRQGKTEDIPQKKIEEALQAQFYMQMPNDFINVTASINAGKPLYLIAPKGELTLALIQWANKLAGTATTSLGPSSLDTPWHKFRRLLGRTELSS